MQGSAHAHSHHTHLSPQSRPVGGPCGGRRHRCTPGPLAGRPAGRLGHPVRAARKRTMTARRPGVSSASAHRDRPSPPRPSADRQRRDRARHTDRVFVTNVRSPSNTRSARSYRVSRAAPSPAMGRAMFSADGSTVLRPPGKHSFQCRGYDRGASDDSRQLARVGHPAHAAAQTDQTRPRRAQAAAGSPATQHHARRRMNNRAGDRWIAAL